MTTLEQKTAAAKALLTKELAELGAARLNRAELTSRVAELYDLNITNADVIVRRFWEENVTPRRPKTRSRWNEGLIKAILGKD